MNIAIMAETEKGKKVYLAGYSMAYQDLCPENLHNPKDFQVYEFLGSLRSRGFIVTMVEDESDVKLIPESISLLKVELAVSQVTSDDEILLDLIKNTDNRVTAIERLLIGNTDLAVLQRLST